MHEFQVKIDSLVFAEFGKDLITTRIDRAFQYTHPRRILLSYVLSA